MDDKLASENTICLICSSLSELIIYIFINQVYLNLFNSAQLIRAIGLICYIATKTFILFFNYLDIK